MTYFEIKASMISSYSCSLGKNENENKNEIECKNGGFSIVTHDLLFALMHHVPQYIVLLCLISDYLLLHFLLSDT